MWNSEKNNIINLLSLDVAKIFNNISYYYLIFNMGDY